MQFKFKYARTIISQTFQTWFPFNFNTPLLQYTAFDNFVKVRLRLQINHFWLNKDVLKQTPR